jgi:hypothetical protein
VRRLIRKKDVLPPDALEIPWRPFYNLLDKLYFGKLRGSLEIHRQHGTAVCKLIRVAREFFAPSATAEILETFRSVVSPSFHTVLIFLGSVPDRD